MKKKCCPSNKESALQVISRTREIFLWISAKALACNLTHQRIVLPASSQQSLQAKMMKEGKSVLEAPQGNSQSASCRGRRGQVALKQPPSATPEATIPTEEFPFEGDFVNRRGYGNSNWYRKQCSIYEIPTYFTHKMYTCIKNQCDNL